MHTMKRDFTAEIKPQRRDRRSPAEPEIRIDGNGELEKREAAEFLRRLRRFNAEAQRFAEIRREFFFSAFLRVPLR